MPTRLSEFDAGYSELCKYVRHLLASKKESVELLVHKLERLDENRVINNPAELLEKYISQFMIVYLGSGWHRGHAWNCDNDDFGQLFDASIKDFSESVPVTDLTALAIAEPLAKIAVQNAGRARIDLTQWVIQRTDKALQKTLGMFFTPPALADYVVARVDNALASKFENGTVFDRLVENVPAKDFRIVDPALGSGEIILALIRRVAEAGHAQNIGREKLQQTLLNAMEVIVGFEIHPVALLSAHFRMLALLDEHIELEQCNVRLNFKWQSAFNVLEDDEANDFRGALIVVGNPPYGALTKSSGTPVAKLLQGKKPGGKNKGKNVVDDSAGMASYFVDEHGPIKERKTWLYDLYVQFFRLAQYMVDKCDRGIVGFVSNRGFIDNVTFRGMRYQLSRSFDAIEITDLGGDRRSAKKHNDENTFGIETPVAVSVFSKTGRANSSVHYWKLNGTAMEKFDQLNQAANVPQLNGEVSIRSPSGQLFSGRAKYQSSDRLHEWPIDQIMPFKGSPIITARDSLVVALGKEELTKKLSEFCDGSVVDDVIREKYFRRSRSSQYQRGDTRGWSLANVRNGLLNKLCEINIQNCCYRPFDQRYLAWSDELIDWPRRELMDCLCERGNFGLISRRQSPPDLRWNYIWSCRQLAVDGIIRSDNRGNESIFPIWYQSRLNFSEEFIACLATNWQVQIKRSLGAQSNLNNRVIGGTEIGAYIYGLFHSDQYRQQFDGRLQFNFAPVVIAKDWTRARQMIAIGKRLLCLHNAPLKSRQCPNDLSIKMDFRPGNPRYLHGNIYVGATVIANGVDADVWNHKIGTYQVLQKWLKNRRGILFSDNTIGQFIDLVRRISKSIKLSKELDACLRSAGNWNNIFLN